MNIYLDSVGCRLNQAEIEMMARQFRAAGHDIVASPGTADLAIVNTCAVTAEAASDSRAMIRRLAGGGVARVIATGCWATLEPQQAQILPGVSEVVENGRKDRLVPAVLNIREHVFDMEPIARTPLPGARRRTRAFIKVQDGCNNRCTFCITTVARGASQSRPIADVIRDVRSAMDGGSREVVLTGVHLGSWGHDMRMDLKVLVRAVLNDTDVSRLRLSSLEPWDLDADFFALWEDRRLCRHLHLPLQSGCAATLRRMARKTTPASFRALASAARAVMPDVAITTDVIAGFPGETQDEFAESLDFVGQMNFAGGHAFTYSARPGTAAARRSDQIPVQLRRERTRRYIAGFAEAASAYRQTHVGQIRSVLWESATCRDGEGWELEGLTETYMRVKAKADDPRWNEIDAVELTEALPDGLRGLILK